ncbi:MAG: hypothetical protein J6O51_06520 [Bacteroidales bacterium]|nr:hypothetical protein [Bacteroidales bacterium]
MAQSDLAKALLKVGAGLALLAGSIFTGAAGKKTIDHARNDYSNFTNGKTALPKK